MQTDQHYCTVIIHALAPAGAPLMYLNDGEVRVIFLDLKFWPKVIFWVYERHWDFFGSQRKTEGFFGVAKNRLRDFLGMLKKVIVICLRRQILKL